MLHIENYKGFGNKDRIYLRGRLLNDPIILPYPSKSSFVLAIDNIRRFLSREKKHYPLSVEINGTEYPVATDDEGYYTLENRLSIDNDKLSLEAFVSGKNVHKGKHEIIFSNPNAEYGVISDIDDTILHSQVTSIIKMLYYSFFKTPWERAAIKNASMWFSELSKEGKNPFFYISHSPWNIYQNIIKFMELSKFPEGPVLLRDYGFHILEKPREYSDHKRIFISKILDFHPGLPFILIGDAAEKDAHIYFEFLDKSSERIKHVFIRKNKFMNQDLSYYKKHPKFTLIEDFEEAHHFQKKKLF